SAVSVGRAGVVQLRRGILRDGIEQSLRSAVGDGAVGGGDVVGIGAGLGDPAVVSADGDVVDLFAGEGIAVLSDVGDVILAGGARAEVVEAAAEGVAETVGVNLLGKAGGVVDVGVAQWNAITPAVGDGLAVGVGVGGGLDADH